MRFEYGGPYRNEERAEMALENMFASGDVCDGELPRIEQRGGKKTASWSKPSKRFWVITVRGE